MKEKIEKIISENSVEEYSKSYGNGLFISMDTVGIIAESIVKLCNLHIVSQQRELLLDFILFNNRNKPEIGKWKRPTERVSDFLESNNCG